MTKNRLASLACLATSMAFAALLAYQGWDQYFLSESFHTASGIFLLVSAVGVGLVIGPEGRASFANTMIQTMRRDLKMIAGWFRLDH